MSTRHQLITVCVLCSMFIIGCSDGSDGGNGSTTAPFQELYDQGIDRYIGVFTPMTSETLDGDVTRHSFGGGDGPLCYTGNEFNMSTRDGKSDELLIFLQGGGACGPTNCSAVPVGLPLFQRWHSRNRKPVQPGDGLRPGLCTLLRRHVVHRRPGCR